MSDHFPPLLKSGDKISRNYIVIRHLGSGSFAHTYLCGEYRGAEKVEEVVVKVMHNNEADIAEVKSVYLLRKHKHPNIPLVNTFETRESLDFENDKNFNQNPFIVYEYIPGTISLEDFINKNLPDDGTDSQRLPLDDNLLSFFRNLADAIDHANQNGVYHCDIKPSNVLIEAGNYTGWLIDFGLAQLISVQDEKSYERSNKTVGGTLNYIAPELLHGRTTIDSSKIGSSSDIYSFGVLVYKTITGVLPFNRFPDGFHKLPLKPVSKLVQWLGDEVDNKFEKVLAFESSDRYETCNAFIKALDDASEKSRSQRLKFEQGREALDRKDYITAQERLQETYDAFQEHPELEEKIGRYLWEAKHFGNRDDKFKKAKSLSSEDNQSEALRLLHSLSFDYDVRDTFTYDELTRLTKTTAYVQVIQKYTESPIVALGYWAEFKDFYDNFDEAKFVLDSSFSLNEDEWIGKKLDRELELQNLEEKLRVCKKKRDYENVLEILEQIEQLSGKSETERKWSFSLMVDWSNLVGEALDQSENLDTSTTDTIIDSFKNALNLFDKAGETFPPLDSDLNKYKNEVLQRWYSEAAKELNEHKSSTIYDDFRKQYPEFPDPGDLTAYMETTTVTMNKTKTIKNLELMKEQALKLKPPDYPTAAKLQKKIDALKGGDVDG